MSPLATKHVLLVAIVGLIFLPVWGGPAWAFAQSLPADAETLAASRIVQVFAGFAILAAATMPAGAVAYKIWKSVPKPALAMASALSSAQDVTIYQELGEIKGKLSGIQTEMARLAGAIDGIHAEVDSEQRHLRSRMVEVESWQRARDLADRRGT